MLILKKKHLPRVCDFYSINLTKYNDYTSC